MTSSSGRDAEHAQPRKKRTRILYLVTEDWYFVSHHLGLAQAVRDAGADVVVITRIRDHAEIIKNQGFRLGSGLITATR